MTSFVQTALELQVQQLQHRIQELQASQLKGGEEVEERVLQLQVQLEQILKSEADTRAALQQETANLATTLEMNSDAIAFIESLKQSLKNLEEVRPSAEFLSSFACVLDTAIRSAYLSCDSSFKAKLMPNRRRSLL